MRKILWQMCKPPLKRLRRCGHIFCRCTSNLRRRKPFLASVSAHLQSQAPLCKRKFPFAGESPCLQMHRLLLQMCKSPLQMRNPLRRNCQLPLQMCRRSRKMRKRKPPFADARTLFADVQILFADVQNPLCRCTNPFANVNIPLQMRKNPLQMSKPP